MRSDGRTVVFMGRIIIDLRWIVRARRTRRGRPRPPSAPAARATPRLDEQARQPDEGGGPAPEEQPQVTRGKARGRRARAAGSRVSEGAPRPACCGRASPRTAGRLPASRAARPPARRARSRRRARTGSAAGRPGRRRPPPWDGRGSGSRSPRRRRSRGRGTGGTVPAPSRLSCAWSAWYASWTSVPIPSTVSGSQVAGIEVDPGRGGERRAGRVIAWLSTRRISGASRDGRRRVQVERRIGGRSTRRASSGSSAPSGKSQRQRRRARSLRRPAAGFSSSPRR